MLVGWRTRKGVTVKPSAFVTALGRAEGSESGDRARAGRAVCRRSDVDWLCRVRRGCGESLTRVGLASLQGTLLRTSSRSFDGKEKGIGGCGHRRVGDQPVSLDSSNSRRSPRRGRGLHPVYLRLSGSCRGEQSESESGREGEGDDSI